MIGKIPVIAVIVLLCMNLAHAGLENEIAQQQKKEEHLQAQLEIQKKISAQAYKDAAELVEDSIINRGEQLNRLEAAHVIWDEFIDKTCLAESLESIGTRAERANKLQCMINKHKEKEIFFKSLI